MKKLITILIVGLVCNFSYGQTFNTYFVQENSTSKVQILIDTSFTNSGILVKKQFISQIDDDLYNQNSLILLGNFEIENNEATLDYRNYNYYFMPFNPDEGFQSLKYEDSILVGTLYIGSSTAQQRSISNPGDIWYWCSCNGDYDIEKGPRGCVSSLDNGVVDCVVDGECPGYCKGEATIEPYYIINGGGVFVQVSKEKASLYHDFRTGSQ